MSNKIIILFLVISIILSTVSLIVSITKKGRKGDKGDTGDSGKTGKKGNDSDQFTNLSILEESQKTTKTLADNNNTAIGKIIARLPVQEKEIKDWADEKFVYSGAHSPPGMNGYYIKTANAQNVDNKKPWPTQNYRLATSYGDKIFPAGGDSLELTNNNNKGFLTFNFMPLKRGI